MASDKPWFIRLQTKDDGSPRTLKEIEDYSTLDDIRKVNKKYYEQMRNQLTYEEIKSFFPTFTDRVKAEEYLKCYKELHEYNIPKRIYGYLRLDGDTTDVVFRKAIEEKYGPIPKMERGLFLFNKWVDKHKRKPLHFLKKTDKDEKKAAHFLTRNPDLIDFIKYPFLKETQTSTAFKKMIKKMPKNVKLKDGQKWKGTHQVYVFVDKDYGEFKRSAKDCMRSWKNGLTGHPKRSRLSVTTGHSKPVLCTTNNKKYKSANDAARLLNLWPASVCQVCNGRSSHTGGFKFKYVKKG